MKYNDEIYGTVRLPHFIDALADTAEFQRLKGISQATIPEEFSVLPLPNRYDHSLGVCALAQMVVESNKLPKNLATLLLVSALLHDTGNPPFSHVGEHFLRRWNGHDGESHLANMLDSSETWLVLSKMGLSLQELVGMVTGTRKPFAAVLHGSMDIDNLDNVNRYWRINQGKSSVFDGCRIATSFKYVNDRWQLSADCIPEAHKWQKNREQVYAALYSNTQLTMSQMIWRAMDIAFGRGLLTERFFYLTDIEAAAYLCDRDRDCQYLLDRAITRDLYIEAFSLETRRPTERFRNILARHANPRGYLAKLLCNKLRLPERDVCVHISKGRDSRRIDLPFVNRRGKRVKYIQASSRPLYRLKVYVSGNADKYRSKIDDLFKNRI